MRIGKTKLVQLVEGVPHQVVLSDEETGAEVALDPVELGLFLRTIEHFSAHVPNLVELPAAFATMPDVPPGVPEDFVGPLESGTRDDVEDVLG